MVFIDDSPMECELVKTALPQITVLTVPEYLYSYPQMLWKENWFDTLSVNEEDLHRTTMYQQENSRKKYAEKFDKLDEYLKSLGIEVTIQEVKGEDVARVAQLTQKTNQFNLSVKRYSENDIQKLIDSNSHMVFSLAAKNKFGSYGLTGVFVATKQHSTGVIDSFLLSCRILSRNLEYVFMSYCLSALDKLWKIETWRADFSPTEKNAQVERFLAEFGFTVLDANSQKYQMLASAHYKIKDYIKIIEVPSS
jgi:FkbH-like protein